MLLWSCVATILIQLVVLVGRVSCHGRLIEPPSRSSMWRFGFDTPANYDDASLNCGGRWRQWTFLGGRCGVCGDRYDVLPRPNEAGGKYATGTIGRTYLEGETILVNIELTANYNGWFEFRLCVNNDVNSPITHECLDAHILLLTGGLTGTQFQVSSGIVCPEVFSLFLQLPAGVVCSQCVLQWKYHTAYYTSCANGRCCRGCGNQEEFYGCADIEILSTMGIPTTPLPVTDLDCKAIGDFAIDPTANLWCFIACSTTELCPQDICNEFCLLLATDAPTDQFVEVGVLANITLPKFEEIFGNPGNGFHVPLSTVIPPGRRRREGVQDNQIEDVGMRRRILLEQIEREIQKTTEQSRHRRHSPKT